LITFTNDKTLIVSSTFSNENLEKLNLQPNQFFPDLPIQGREIYLEYHRSKIFLH
jgi:hypothetical protein